MLTTNQRGLVRTSVSSTEPLTLSEAKLYLRIDSMAEDTLITNLMTVCREHAEHYLKRAIIDQNWRLELDDYAPKTLRLPMGPIISITSVNVIDSEGGSTTISSDLYNIKTGRDQIEFDTILYANTIQINYRSGYATTAEIPASIRHGMLSHLAALYECRGESNGKLPSDTMSLYSAHREVLL